MSAEHVPTCELLVRNGDCTCPKPTMVVTVHVPPVAFPGGTSQAYRSVSALLRGGYPVGGSNLTAAVATLLANIADALDRAA